MKDVVISINSIHRVTGLPGTRTSVEIRPDEVIVDRTGSITSRMVFRRGEKNRFQYETPYGMATLGMSTQRIRHDIGAKGGSVEIDYVLDVEHAVVERNRFCLNVREQ